MKITIVQVIPEGNGASSGRTTFSYCRDCEEPRKHTWTIERKPRRGVVTILGERRAVLNAYGAPLELEIIPKDAVRLPLCDCRGD